MAPTAFVETASGSLRATSADAFPPLPAPPARESDHATSAPALLGAISEEPPEKVPDAKVLGPSEIGNGSLHVAPPSSE